MNELVDQVETATMLFHDLNPSVAYPGFAESTLGFLGPGFR
jgi:hypothetical protein